MSGTRSGSASAKETNLVASLSRIVDVDLAQAIGHVKKLVLKEESPFCYDRFKKHSQSLKALQELIDVVPKSQGNDEKSKGETAAVEGLITDICLPFLHAFAPSFDGRAELSAAVLNVCDLILICLKRSTQETVVKVLGQCLQSLLAFHHACTRHSESASEQALDILCALELLFTTLEIPVLPEDNQNHDFYHQVFSASLSLLSHLDEKLANRLISYVIIKIVQQQNTKKDAYLEQVWSLIETDVSSEKKVSSKTLQQHLTMICSMANVFFPLTDEPVSPDLRQKQVFWELVQLGLYHENPALRKRSLYLLKRIIDTCEKSEGDFNTPDGQSLSNCGFPFFWWSKKHQDQLSKIWEDVQLLLETFDEKQTHVIKPILPRMQTLVNASKQKNGSMLLHTSWLVTILMRALNHESVYMIRWAAETALFMDFSAVPFQEQAQLQFLTEQLLCFLQDLKLYQRPEGSPVGSCTAIGTGLKIFFANVCQSLTCKQHKVEFVVHVLRTLLKDNWHSVPLVFISQGLSCISPDAFLDRHALTTIRDVMVITLLTLESYPRGAIECFLTKTMLNLLDKEAVSVEDFTETLAVVERGESLQRGTGLWTTAVDWILASDSEAQPQQPAWTWAAMEKGLETMVDTYLTVSADTTGDVLTETTRVTQIGRLAALMSDGQRKQRSSNSSKSMGAGEEGRAATSLLAATLVKTTDIINSVNSRVYMPALKADRAIAVLLSCAREFGTDPDGAQDWGHAELCSLVLSCWDELLLLVERRTLHAKHDTEQDSVDLDHVIFYADAVHSLGLLLPAGAGVNGLQKLADSCSKMTETPDAFPPLQRVAAVNLLSSVAKVVGVKLTAQLKAGGTRKEEGLTQLCDKLWKTFAAMSLDSEIHSGHTGGSSLQHGRQVCQHMVSVWECLRVLLTHRPTLRPPDLLLHAALEAFSVSSGQCEIPIMHCLQLIIPQLLHAKEHEEKVMQLMRIAWSKVTEEVKSWSFWLKMAAYVDMVLQKPLLLLDADTEIGAHMTEVLDRFFDFGEERGGILNLVIARLSQLWTGPEGIALATRMVATIVDACIFGTIHKKSDRMYLDVCMYIERLKEDCSVNEILSSSSKNDIYVRLMALNFLSTLKREEAQHRALVVAVLQEAWGRYRALYTMDTFRQYSGTLPHRHKHRLVHVFPLLDRFIHQGSCVEWCRRLWESLSLECHPSVRQNLEWLVMRLVQRYPTHLLPSLWDYYNQFSEKRNVSLSSLLHITTRLGPELPVELREDFYMKAIPLVVPWTMAHHFNTRLFGQAALYQLWTQCNDMQLQARNISIVAGCMKFLVENRNASSVLAKLLDNYFYTYFHFLRDYSMETLFYTLPRLAGFSDEEWMHPDMFSQLDAAWLTNAGSHLLPLFNADTQLADCKAGAWKMKATAESSDDASDSIEGNVQKKVIPWRLMTPDSNVEQEYSCRKKGRSPDGLVLVTSLINKIPNLGGLCRTSEIFGVSEFVIGNLGYVNDRMFQTLSVTAEKWIPITEVLAHRLNEYLEEKKRDSYTLVGVEQTANSVDLTQYKFPKKTLLVLGNEKEGIPHDVLQQLDVCVEIPQQGIIRSLNVHVSGALLVWEYTRQQLERSEAEKD